MRFGCPSPPGVHLGLLPEREASWLRIFVEKPDGVMISVHDLRFFALQYTGNFGPGSETQNRT